MLVTQNPTSSSRSVWPNVVRASLGNLVEWFDWFIYAWFAIYFAAAFFPAHDATAQLLSTAVVFAIGFLMRPLGGWVLGLYADRRGRRAALTLSVSLMSAGSLAIAFNPGYESIGIAAPVLLVVARITQGLSLGGEFGTSASYLTEVADPRRRNFFASFQFVSIVLGQLLALADDDRPAAPPLRVGHERVGMAGALRPRRPHRPDGVLPPPPDAGVRRLPRAPARARRDRRRSPSAHPARA